MGLSCDITTISYTDCILTIEDSSGNSISEFFLSSLKILVNGTDETLYLNDGVSEITINLSQLPSINGGAFVTLADLDTFIRTQRNLCQCGCGGGGGSGITSINADTTAVQTLSVGTSGTDFNIVDNGLGDHKFNLPTASATNRGALSTTDWSNFNGKQNALGFTPENVVNKQNSLAVDGTGVKYPTVDATNSGLATKEPTITTLSIAKGGTNSGTALSNNRVMQSSGGAIIEAAAITASRVLISDVNGIPIHSTITSATLAFLDATSSIQTQLNNKGLGIINCNPNDTIAALTTSYWQPFSSAADSTTETSRIWYSNVSGILKYFLIRTSTSQPGTGNQVITIRHELASTSITLTIAAGSAAGTFTDYVNTHTIAQGDRISIQSINNATATAGAQVNQITFIVI